VAPAIDHYERLGFTTTQHDGCAFATRGNLAVDLVRDEDPDAHMTSVLYVQVDGADEVAERWRKAGLEVEEPENQDYGRREGRHIDADGNVVRLGGPPW
jgi:uncharacterized glyoxalase superfamily protein PhnB